jgi:MYXO-CTERM domain-containing protein
VAHHAALGEPAEDDPVPRDADGLGQRVLVQWLPEVPFVAGSTVSVGLSYPISDRALGGVFRITDFELKKLSAPDARVVGQAAKTAPDVDGPKQTCKLSGAAPRANDCGGADPVAEKTFATQLRNEPLFLVDVTKTVPVALEPFVSYGVGPEHTALGTEQNGYFVVSVGNVAAGKSLCVDVGVKSILDDAPRTAQACATVAAPPPVSAAAQDAWLQRQQADCAAAPRPQGADNDMVAPAGPFGGCSTGGAGGAGGGALGWLLALGAVFVARRRNCRGFP